MSHNSETTLRRAATDLDEQTAGKPASESLPAYKRFRRLEEHRLRLRISSGAGGREVVRQRSDLVDILFRRLFAQVCGETAGRVAPPGFTVVAFGGYGRREMNPFSDVDIMFLHADHEISPPLEAAVQEIIRMLWDMGFKVGHSVRTVSEAITRANSDLQIKTAILESRCLCGDRELFASLRSEFTRKCIKGPAMKKAYIAWRLQNQRELHERHGRIVCMQEPDIKHGTGGLRDYHNLIWIGTVLAGAGTTARIVEKKFLTESERRLLEKAYDFLLRVRTEMHFIHNRPSDILNLQLQGQVATRLGYPQRHMLQRVEAFMRDYYHHARDIKRISTTAIHRMVPEQKPATGLRRLLSPRRARTEHFDGFIARNGLLYAASPSVFTEDPQRLMRLFRYAQMRRLDLSPALADLVRRKGSLVNRTFQYSRDARETFLAILSHKGDVGRILRMMHEADFLGRYLPEFGRLTFLVQHEFFHRYTADEHTLLCIDKLDALLDTDDPKFLGYRELFQRDDDSPVLYLALLLHDTGKAEHGRNHEQASATLAARVGRRLQLSSLRKRKLIALVDNHLTLSKTAQSRDLDDPATIAHFCNIVQSSDCLDPLMLVTLADGQGTSDTAWSDWKEVFAWQLYRAARAYFDEGRDYFHRQRVDVEGLRSEVRAKLPADYDNETGAHFEQMPERYFRTFNASQISGHLRMFRAFYRRQAISEDGLAPVLKWIHHPSQGHSEVLLCGWDCPGLIKRIAGAFLSARANVLSADIYTRSDNLVLDVFRVCDARHKPIVSERDQKLVEKLLCESLANPCFDFAPHITRARQKMTYHMSQDADIPTRIAIDSEGHPSFTIADIETPDRIGLLYDLLGAITQFGLSIELARITTEKEVAMDTFYLCHAHDRTKLSDSDITTLQRTLHAAAKQDSAVPVASLRP